MQLRDALNEASEKRLQELLSQASLKPFAEAVSSRSGGGLVPLRKADGSAYEVTKPFKPTTASGTETVEFTIDASNLAYQKIVVYEELSMSGTILAEHKDPNDSEQTVRVDTPGIHTKAESRDGSKYITPSQGTTIIDTVTMTGLTAGETYTLSGTLMDKATGNPVYNGGLPVTTRAEFKARGTEDETRVTFTVNTSALIGKQLVVYEKLYLGDTLIAAHEDLSTPARP